MQSWGLCEELPADLWLHEDHRWSSYASPQVHNDENGSISASLGKYSTKHCKVVASMSSLVFLGCSKVVTSTHENVVKTQNVWGILSDNLVHLILIPLHSANKRPLHHAPALFHTIPRSKCFFPFVQDGLVQLKKLTSGCHANGFAGSNDLCRCPANWTHILKCPKIVSSHPFYQRFLGTSWESCLAPKHSARLRDCDLWLPWSLVQQSAIPRASESASRTDLP